MTSTYSPTTAHGACKQRLPTSAAWRSPARTGFTGPLGPARLAITDGGLTFASNGDRGVLLSFREPVPAIDPLRLIRHPELTVTVADVHGLVSALGTDRVAAAGLPPTLLVGAPRLRRRQRSRSSLAGRQADAIVRGFGWRSS